MYCKVPIDGLTIQLSMSLREVSHDSIQCRKILLSLAQYQGQTTDHSLVTANDTFNMGLIGIPVGFILTFVTVEIGLIQQ